jgi:hypothetical protein
VDQFWQIIQVILFSSVKFVLGPSYVYLNENYDFTFFQTNLYCIAGGMLGVGVFMFFSSWIIRAYRNIRKFYFNVFRRKRQQLFSPPVADVEENVLIHYDYVERNHPPIKIFSKSSRRIIKIWQRYGLIGLAALTPVLFSIPIGTFVIMRLEPNRKKILLYLFVSVTCWSLLLTSIFELTTVKNIPEIIHSIPPQ